MPRLDTTVRRLYATLHKLHATFFRLQSYVAQAPGDVVAHSFDLQHGVQVTAGRRCSVIFWFTDSAASCADKSRPWCATEALN